MKRLILTLLICAVGLMAAGPYTLVSGVGGNWSAAASWYLADATSELASEAANTVLTTSAVYSSTFQPGAITVAYVCVKAASRAASPTGTMTVVLRNSTDSVDTISVTVNVSDVNTAGTGWYCFDPGAPVLLEAAHDYSIGASTSSATQVNLYSSATTNWSRQLVTTTTQAPAAGDKIIVVGQLTGQTTGTNVTITVDSDLSATVVGSTSYNQSVHVGERGTLAYSIVAAANPKIAVAGIVGIYGGGTLNMGTSGAGVIPDGSKAALIFSVAANVDSGLYIGNGATVNMYGVTKTPTQMLLTADAAATQPVLTVNSTAGSAAGDLVGIASTTQTAAQCEQRTILSIDSPTQMTLTANLTYAHSGTSPTQAEVINLTRNVQIYGTSAALQGYVYVGNTAVVTVRYAEFYWLGSATASKLGIDVTTTTGTFDMQYSALHDFVVVGSRGINVTGAASSGVTFSYNNTYSIISGHFNVALTTGTWTVTGNVFMYGLTNYYAIVVLNDVGGVLTNNTVVGAAGSLEAAFYFSEAAAVGTVAGNVAHSNISAGYGFNLGLFNSTLSTGIAWRNLGGGVSIPSALKGVTFDTWTLFGNATSNVDVSSGVANVTFKNLTSNGDTTFATTNGVNLTSPAAVSGIVCESCDFSTVAGIKTAHTNDINFGGSGRFGQFILRNTKLGGTNPVANLSTAVTGSYVASQRHGTTVANHGVWRMYGLTWIDATNYGGHTPPSLRMTPSSAANKLESAAPDPSPLSPFRAAVASGNTLTVSIKVRKSVVGDGAAYNGNQPRLIVRKNVAAGIAADTVLATAAGAAGSWETLTGTTAAVTDDAVLEILIDCDGTAGWVNVDEFLNLAVVDSKGFKYWFDGMPRPVGDNIRGSRGTAIVW